MGMTTRNFHLGCALIVTLALLVRVIYQLGAEPLVHIAGDINDYVRYAWNLGQHGIYSSAPINADTTPPADSFRPPGYPLFLLLAMRLDGFTPDWASTAYAMQILLSSATVLLTMLLGREWMRPGFALAAGTLTALWPHHVVFASTLLSETLLGFCIALALWLTAVARRRTSVAIALAAGLAFGYAALINTLMLLFPIIVVVVMACTRDRKPALALLLGFSLLPAAWWLASPSPDADTRNNSHRAVMNLVQGSWPHYHQAWRARNAHASARQIMETIDEEIALANEAPRTGMAVILERMSLDPAGYARWYLLEKPYLLWDWDIQLGWGGIHFLPVETTPMERHPMLRTSHLILKSLNPLLFALASIAAVILVISWLRGRNPPFAALLVALFAIYVTGLHTVLQAEPRYSIPYRPEQMLLACGMLAILLTRLLSRTRQRGVVRGAGIQHIHPASHSDSRREHPESANDANLSHDH